MAVRVVWHGDRVNRKVEQVGADAIADAAEFLLEEANRSVPIEEGTLQRSGFADAEGLAATVSYDTPYAARLHENPQYSFQHGRRGKWLQLTWDEQAARVRTFLVDRMKGAFA